MKAFVLKCPECGAPQPGPESVCRYCKVPLMWAPERSLSRDDECNGRNQLTRTARGAHGRQGRDFEIEDEPGTEILSLGPLIVAGGEQKVVQRITPRPFLPLFVWVNPTNAEYFYLSVQFRNLIVTDSSYLLGSLFARGRGLPIQSPALGTGELMTINVMNKSACPVLFEGCIRGKSGQYYQPPSPPRSSRLLAIAKSRDTLPS